MSRGGCSRR
eukprot:gene9702-biopygen15270